MVELAALETAVLDDRIRDGVDDLGCALDALDDVQAAAGEGVEAEVLGGEVATLHVGGAGIGADRTGAGDEEQGVEVEQRVAEGDLAADGAGGEVEGLVGRGIGRGLLGVEGGFEAAVVSHEGRDRAAAALIREVGD